MVLAVLLGLAAVMVPVRGRELALARSAVALSQCEQVARVVRQCVRDTRLQAADGGYGVWSGAGTPPMPRGATVGRTLDFLREANAPAELRVAMPGSWKGPYDVDLAPDPWGRSILVLSVGDPGLVSWCVSAGPDGLLETSSADLEPRGDDVGVRVN